MNELTLTMIVKNEEKNLSRCLESAKGFVHEMIIVDTGSTDKTKDIAQSFGAKVYDFEWNGDFSAARNYALSKSMSDWNLVLDADEQIIKWDSNYLEYFMKNPVSIGKIKVISNFMQNGGEQRSQDYLSRLFPKGVYFIGKIHEQLQSELPRVELPIEIFHTGYFNTDKSERNLQLLHAEQKNNKQNPYILYQLGKQYRSMKKIAEASGFFAEAFTYINRDVNYAVDLMVNYLYTLIDLKQFEKAFGLISSEQNWLNQSPDFHFVCGIFYMNYVLHDPTNNLSYLPSIEKSYLTCLSLKNNGLNEIVIGTSSYLAAYNLAVYYETTGNLSKAKQYYSIAAEDSHQPAINRLNLLT